MNGVRQGYPRAFLLLGLPLSIVERSRGRKRIGAPKCLDTSGTFSVSKVNEHLGSAARLLISLKVENRDEISGTFNRSESDPVL